MACLRRVITRPAALVSRPSRTPILSVASYVSRSLPMARRSRSARQRPRNLLAALIIRRSRTRRSLSRIRAAPVVRVMRILSIVRSLDIRSSLLQSKHSRTLISRKAQSTNTTRHKNTKSNNTEPSPDNPVLETVKPKNEKYPDHSAITTGEDPGEEGSGRTHTSENI